MGDSEDRQDAPDEGQVPEAAPSPEPVGDGSEAVFTEAGLDTGFAEDLEDDPIDLAEVMASLDDSETPPAEEPLDDPAEVEQVHVAAVAEPDSGADVAPEATPEAEESVDAGSLDPEIAALQADLDAEGAEPDEAVVEGAESAADGAEAQAGESLDDIAPGTVAGVEAASEDSEDIVVPDDRPGVPIWPFLVYFGLWIIFAGLLVWQFMQTPAGTPVYELDLYGISILAGLVLTALGPIVAVGVWLAVWLSRPKGARAGLFSRSLIIGAVATLAGVTVWLVALGALDMLRLGRLF